MESKNIIRDSTGRVLDMPSIEEDLPVFMRYYTEDQGEPCAFPTPFLVLITLCSVSFFIPCIFIIQSLEVLRLALIVAMIMVVALILRED